MSVTTASTNRSVLNKIVQLYTELFAHDGYGEIRIEMRILKRGQKEVIVHCGKQYRFVVDQMDVKPTANAHTDTSHPLMERRSAVERRQHAAVPRNFKLERRAGGDRRRQSASMRAPLAQHGDALNG